MSRRPEYRLITIAAGVALALGLAACDRFFGHDDQVRDPMTMRDQGLSCVRSVGADLKGFLNGEDRDPVMVVECLSSALGKFAENTRGASSEGWTRGELSSFFETYFKEESRTSTQAKVEMPARKSDDGIAPFDGNWAAQARRRAVVTELFRWKAALIGGGEATLSRAELGRIRTLLQRLRVPLADWRGQGKLLSFAAVHAGESADIVTLSKVTSAIRQVAELVALELTPTAEEKNGKLVRQPMKLKSLSAFLEQAGIRLLESEERQALVPAIKRFVLGGDASQVGGDEWSELIRQAAELWLGALRIQYGIVQNTNAYDRDVDFIELTARDLFKSLGKMVERHGGLIENDELRQLMTQIENNKFLPKTVRAKSVNSSLEAILGKLFAGNSIENQAELMLGLKQRHIDRLVEVVRDWTEGQRISSQIIGPAEFATIDEVRKSMSLIATAKSDVVGATALLQISELVLRGRPLIHDSLGRLEVAPERIKIYRRADLDTLNITRVMMNAAMRGYSHETARAGDMPQITESEMQELFADLKTMGRDMGIIDVRSLQSGVRTFMEANIFLSVSDGNEFVSLHEMVEWFETVMSAGKIADQMHFDLVTESGCGTPPLDVFGKERLTAKCFRDNIARVLTRRLDHLPTFLRLLETAGREGRTPEFITTLERATRALGDSDLPIESSDLRAMSPVIHYAESLFARFDADRSTLLETREVWDVFPLIRPFIRKLAVDAEGKSLNLDSAYEKAIYSWMLEFGAPPASTKLGMVELWAHRWTMNPFELNIQMFGKHMSLRTVYEKAGFADIVKLLGSFQRAGRDKKNKDLIKFYNEASTTWEAGIAAGDKAMLAKSRDLVQCSSEADADLSRLLQARRADIFTIDPKDDKDKRAEVFAARLKSMVQADPQLQVLCMAF